MTRTSDIEDLGTNTSDFSVDIIKFLRTEVNRCQLQAFGIYRLGRSQESSAVGVRGELRDACSLKSHSSCSDIEHLPLTSVHVKYHVEFIAVLTNIN